MNLIKTSTTMKKAFFLLLGLFVAGLAAFAVPKEIKENPIDKVIKVFVISENEDVTVEAINLTTLDEDVGDVAFDELSKDTNDHQTPAALHSEIFRLDISWRYSTNAYILNDWGKPMQYLKQIRHPISYHRIC
jgi:hypothetical protein